MIIGLGLAAPPSLLSTFYTTTLIRMATESQYRPSIDEYRETLKKREEHIRESWVKAMEVRLVRAELQKCYKFEGVNHIENCKHLAERYLTMLRDNKVTGYKIIEE